MEDSSLRIEQKYRVEYAKSSRSACKKCKSNIDKGELRLAIMVQNRFSDSKQPVWHHFDCFFKTYHPPSTADIGHFNNLKFDDQKKIESMIETQPANNASDFSVEYAKSGKSKCKLCEELIPKNEVRISKLDAEADMGYGPVKRWFHVDCFVSSRNELEFKLSGDKIPGYSMLEDKDQKMIRNKLPSLSRKRKAQKEDGNEADKKPKDDDEIALKKQSDLLYNYISKIEKMKRTDIVRLLEYNNQHVPESNSSKYERLADCMVFGALEKCPECKNGQLVFRIAGYICTGHISEWTTCLYQTQTPARKSFKIPEDIRDSYDFLSTYEFKEHKRVYNKVEAPTSAVNHIERAMQPSTSSTSAIENGTDVAKLPLKGHKVAYVGKMKLSKRALKEKILSLGGKLVDEIDRTVLFIISTQKEVEKEGAKIAKAKTCGVTVVSEDVFDALNEKVDICDLIKRNTISPWGGDVSKKHKTLVDKDKLKSGSGMKSRSGSSKSEPKIQSFKMKAGLVVDPDSGLDHVAHVYKDQNGPYSVVLAKVDIVSNKNSYYKIQLLESDEAKKKHQYWVYRAWGRIGTDIGGDKLEKFKLKSNAIDNFCEVFLEHTGNEWKKKKEFKKLPGRYHIVETHYGNSLDDDKKLVVGNSCLPLPVQDLITMIFDISRMKHQMQEFHLDLAKMPLGKISKDQVMSAYAVLNEISCMIETNEKSLTKMLDASNRFYSLIPHDFGTDNVIVIKNKELLQEKLEMLDSLLEMELAFELVSDIKEEGEDVLKQHYDRLDANIEVLDKNSEEFVIIEKYVKNTHGKTHSQYSLNIINIFIVKRSNEEERYKKYKNLHNRTLLWHGSRVTNYAGILSQGLRIAPPEAPSTGYMFGKGIYFADMVSKSANYCCTTPKDNIGLLLLSEVALGEMWELSDANFVTSLPEGKHSVKGIGKTSPDANEAITLEDGVFVPCGKPIESKKKSTSLLYNEYIVYDVEQVNIKYLLKVEFKYKY